jgi:hypothetical protein
VPIYCSGQFGRLDREAAREGTDLSPPASSRAPGDVLPGIDLVGTDAKLSAFLKRNLPDRWMDAIIFRLVGLPRRVTLGTPTYVL